MRVNSQRSNSKAIASEATTSNGRSSSRYLKVPDSAKSAGSSKTNPWAGGSWGVRLMRKCRLTADPPPKMDIDEIAMMSGQTPISKTNT